MSKKKIIVLISIILSVLAVVAAVFIFRRQIADVITSLSAKRERSGGKTRSDFTAEERESFADI